ncbi:MAG: tetratricopeptide repeat protein [Steroidobacteraceae bacterium]
MSLALLLCAGCANSPSPAPGKSEAALPPSSSQPQTGSDTAAATDSADSTSTSAGSKTRNKKSALSSKLTKSFDEAVARGDTAWQSGDAQMAIYMYVQALSFRPRDFDTLCKLGAIEEKRDDPELAARAFELAAAVKPDDPLIAGHLGLLYLQQNDEDKALTWLSRSAADGSKDWHVYDGLAVAEGHHGDAEAALLHLQQAVALAPAEPLPALHRGQVLFDKGDDGDAELALRAAMEHGTLPEALNLLGQIQAKRREYPQAIDSLLHAVDPPIAYDVVAKLAMANGDNAVAIRYFEQAARLSPIYYAEAHRDAALARERLDASR